MYERALPIAWPAQLSLLDDHLLNALLNAKPLRLFRIDAAARLLRRACAIEIDALRAGPTATRRAY